MSEVKKELNPKPKNLVEVFEHREGNERKTHFFEFGYTSFGFTCFKCGAGDPEILWEDYGNTPEEVHNNPALKICTLTDDEFIVKSIIE